MPTFPSIRNPSYPLDEQVAKPQVSVTFESGHTQSRPRASVPVTKWTLRWNSLLEADYQTLLTFYNANVGGLFDWTHPESAVTYEVRFADDSLSSSIKINGYRDVEVMIQENP